MRVVCIRTAYAIGLIRARDVKRNPIAEKREALIKLNRQANEAHTSFDTVAVN